MLEFNSPPSAQLALDGVFFGRKALHGHLKWGLSVSFKEVANLLGNCLDLRCVRGSVRNFSDNLRSDHVSFARQCLFQKKRRKHVFNLALLRMLGFEELLGEADFRVYQRQVFRQHVKPLFLHRRRDICLEALQLSKD